MAIVLVRRANGRRGRERRRRVGIMRRVDREVAVGEEAMRRGVRCAQMLRDNRVVCDMKKLRHHASLL